MPAPETFCSLPWLHRMIDEEGFHRLCCSAVGAAAVLSDSAGQKLHVSQRLTNDQVLNSAALRRARVQMMRGEWPEACARCKLSEESGAPSIRTVVNQRFERFGREDLLARTEPDGALREAVVRYADLRLGNVCNLTCRMCGPKSSRLWAPHFNEVQPAAYRLAEDQLRIFGQNNWVKQEPLEALFEQIAPHVQAVQLAGGEPLIIPEMAEALAILIRSGRAGEIELSYNTNLTTLPEKVTSLWPHFKRVQLIISVDGYGAVNDYIRRPSKWEQIDRNLRVVDQHYTEWKIADASLACAVQMYNILSLPDLFQYLRTAGLRHLAPLPILTPLFEPAYLSIQCLPASAKRTARKRLLRELSLAEQNHAVHTSQIGGLRTILTFLDADAHEEHLPDFLSFSEASDRTFGDSWRKACPDLARHLEPRGFRGLIRRIVRG